MPSNIDKAFIQNLQNFTESLENIVELLKQQSEKGDAVNQMLSTMDGPSLSEISKDIKEILEVSKNIDNRTKQILEEVKASRKQKEAGMFDKIQGKDNKSKITDGIQTVILIAGGVLAIGLAFKIIGKVDFLSVVALSAGMLLVSKAFAEIANIKELTPTKTLMTGLALVAIAGAITLSSFVLQYFKPMNPAQLFSFAVVSAALGAGAYFIFKAVKSLDMKPADIWKYLLLPLILPAIAAGIVLSSYVMAETKPVGLMQAISAIFVGIALVAGAFAVSLVIKALKSGKGEMNIKEVGMALLLVPGIAAGIVASSFIFMLFQPLKDPMGTVLSSLAMGLSLIAFLPAVFVLGKMDIKSMLIGALGAVVVSVAIMASSWILSIGNYDNFPSAKWALGVGLSLILFTAPILVIGFIAMSGIGALAVLAGAGLILVVAAAIMATSYILSLGKYDAYPPLKWAAGVGLALLTFGTGMVALGFIAMTGIGALAILAGIGLTLTIANTIVKLGHIFNRGSYDIVPPIDWIKSVGLIMATSSLFLVALGAIALSVVGGLAFLAGVGMTLIIATTMVQLSKILSQGSFTGNITQDWVKGVLGLFAIVDKVPSKDKLSRLKDFIKVLEDFSKAADKLKSSGIDKLSKLTASVTIMSVIDDQKLQSVIRVLDVNKQALGNVIEAGTTTTTTGKQITTPVQTTGIDTSTALSDKQDIMIERFDTVIRKFDQLLEYVVQEQGPSGTGKKDSVKR